MKTTMILRHAALAVCAFAALSGTPHAGDDTLYRQFGEQAGLTRIVDDLYDNVLADPRTALYFENAPIKRIKSKLVEQFCVLLGGPCEYTGRPMRRTHEGQNIDRAAFDALVEDLQAAMDKNGVPFHAQNKLLAKLAPMYRDVQDRE
ncbi:MULTISPECIES: group 1 truncated hemoglobin [unclassified Caballeronia]|uniref:group I truncated hemoglobin n=1 Tax=unclassified Caballeronia TaxID=2646786 RepID=UPI002029980B|nr:MULTISPECIES: group 1 truncated hemoglobin [unclassified Caballeronia]